MMPVGRRTRGSGGSEAARVDVCPARDHLFLMPVSMRDWLDEGHVAYFVLTWSAGWTPRVVSVLRVAVRASRRMSRR